MCLFLKMAILSASLSILGIILSWIIYRRPQNAPEPGNHPVLLSAFYLDPLYHNLIVRPYRWAAARLWQQIDKGKLDKNLEGLGTGFNSASMMMRLLTTGRLSTYLRAFMIGLIGLLALITGRVTIW